MTYVSEEEHEHNGSTGRRIRRQVDTLHTNGTISTLDLYRIAADFGKKYWTLSLRFSTHAFGSSKACGGEVLSGRPNKDCFMGTPKEVSACPGFELA
jgi:hypothetical protein